MQVVPVDGIKSAVALAWDSKTESIFWSDVDQDSISSAHLNGSNQKVIVRANLSMWDLSTLQIYNKDFLF